MYHLYLGSTSRGIKSLGAEPLLFFEDKELASSKAGSTGCVYFVDVDLDSGNIANFNIASIRNLYSKYRDILVKKYHGIDLPDVDSPEFLDPVLGFPYSKYSGLDIIFEDLGFKAVWLASNEAKVLEAWHPNECTHIIEEIDIKAVAYHADSRELDDFENMHTVPDFDTEDKVKDQREDDYLNNLLDSKRKLNYAKSKVIETILKIAESLSITKDESILNLIDSILLELE